MDRLIVLLSFFSRFFLTPSMQTLPLLIYANFDTFWFCSIDCSVLKLAFVFLIDVPFFVRFTLNIDHLVFLCAAPHPGSPSGSFVLRFNPTC